MIPKGSNDAVCLSSREQERYLRQISLAEIGAEGQARLSSAKALCIGVGGLGSPATMYLAAAGIGTLGLIDPDAVCRTNLHRQVLFNETDVGKAKTGAARNALGLVNPHCEVVLHPGAFSPENGLKIAKDYDLIIDGTDNFSTRYLSNDVAVQLRIPNVYASIFKFEGQVSVFHPAQTGGCYRCMFPNPPDPGAVPSCAESGVLGVLPGIIGTIQAAEALKLILGIGSPLLGRLLHIDTLGMNFRQFNLRKDPKCPSCGTRTLRVGSESYGLDCGVAPAGKPSAGWRSITPSQLAKKMATDPSILLIDVREVDENSFSVIPGAICAPLSELASRTDTMAVAKNIVVYCNSTLRSIEAAALLEAKGLENVEILEGGLAAWLSERDTPI